MANNASFKEIVATLIPIWDRIPEISREEAEAITFCPMICLDVERTEAWKTRIAALFAPEIDAFVADCQAAHAEELTHGPDADKCSELQTRFAALSAPITVGVWAALTLSDVDAQRVGNHVFAQFYHRLFAKLLLEAFSFSMDQYGFYSGISGSVMMNHAWQHQVKLEIERSLRRP